MSTQAEGENFTTPATLLMRAHAIAVSAAPASWRLPTMNRDEFLRRYHWLPADTDDRLDWLVMIGGAWMVYALAGVVCFIWR